MRLALKQRSLVATIIVIAVALIALTVLCADGVHVPLASSVGEACASMTHAAGLGAASDANVASAIASMFAVAIVGFALMFQATFAQPESSRTSVYLVPAANPMNGRLRI